MQGNGTMARSAAPAPRATQAHGPRRARAALEHGRAVLLFDGVCNLCNGAVLFIIDRDPAGHIRFAPLQSDYAAELLERYGHADLDMQSLVLIENGRSYTRSTGALRIARHLSGAWPLLYALIVVPQPLRDAVYGAIARYRYRWFGRTESCRMPTPDLQSRFIATAITTTSRT
jgi:predicted DCC family thiol-disulfide oxidoreductase YuxK